MNWKPRDGWSPVAIFSLRHEAEFLAERLHDAGIPAQVLGDDCGTMGLGLQLSNGLAVYVSDRDLEQARTHLQHPENAV